MKNKKIIIYGILLIIGIPLFSTYTTQAQEGYKLTVPIPGGTSEPTSIGDYLYTIFRFALYAGGILAIFMIVIGGIQYTISRGNPSKIEESADRIKSAILGLILLLSASAILFFINPQLILLNVPGVEPIKAENCAESYFGLGDFTKSQSEAESSALAECKKVCTNSSACKVTGCWSCKDGKYTLFTQKNGVETGSCAERLDGLYRCTASGN
ncbi:MAG: hypothetical protein COU07_03755 [Candidatus Harrisonbacteria bacterium CG10_big_fil_rev_8_21_14_0_10_40_38]|uniref:Uncharacterized protein n=1 Tax=Candidatus Harrisonbacteria bacterium CG10_big_fil_rev_8_21_14_0_10_40_38 TaxID=1974583 RepID=A0A2H0URF6_9BACT|nr:MAG: hypothetical protein COU07_03755 [Candidatus Harrisonbacteria bacterium CG10_big_fil_rev_8_21_14_0_10_40_38]